MASLSLDHIKEAYTELGNIPSPCGGRILTDDMHTNLYRVETKWSTMDVMRRDRFPISRTFFIPLNAERTIESASSIVSCPATSQEAGHLWDVWSPSEALRAVIVSQNPKNGKGDEKQFFLQVWNSQQLVKSINLSEKEKHGKVYDNDKMLGWCAWSNDEGHIAYLAEAKTPKKFSHFSAKAADNGEEEKEKPDSNIEIGTEYDYVDDWGEQMVGKSKSVLCVLDLETETVMTVDNIPDNICPGQAVWCPDDTGFIFVGIECQPYRLGSIYCEQRPSGIFHLDLAKGTCVQISADGMAVNSPRFSPNGHSLVWLENRAFGAHRQCKRLMMVHWRSSPREPHTVIDFVHKAGENAFPGIFCMNLPRRCWSSDSRRIIFHSEWRSQCEVMVVDTKSKVGCHLPDNIAIGHNAVVDVHNDLILAVQSSPSRPQHFVIAALPAEGSEKSVEWIRLPNQPGVVEGIQWKILTHVPGEAGEHPVFGRASFQSILLSPDLSETSTVADFSKRGQLVVYPHGGPHGVITAQFLLTPAALCRLGFSVLLVNYRGSTGFGQDSIETLPGRIGTLDVLDCHQAVTEVLANAEETGVNENRVCVCGGSHGGFLTVHLIGQYPDFYRAASCRNPVINLSSQLGTSDIPDWACYESGFDYRFGDLPTADILTKMWSVSPLRYADQIRTPLLIALGAKDRRCPPQQGMELYKALVARKAPVRLSVYPEECHPIDSVPACSDAFVNMVKWFVDHLGR